MDNQIFLTGGSGFVGRNLIPFLKEKGYEVVALARSNESLQAVESYGAKGVLGDITDFSSLKKAMMGCSIVIHAAAHMDFWGPKETFMRINVHGTKNVLKATTVCGIHTCIYIGAASVINGAPILDYDETYIPPKPPKDYYSLTKSMAEKEVIQANSTALRTVVLRPPAIWGPNNPHYDEMLSRVKEGKWMWIGKGTHHLSTIHVHNLAQAVTSAIDNGKGGEIYFVTDGEKRPVKSLFTQIFQKQGLDPGNRSLPRGWVLAMAKGVSFIWKRLSLQGKPPIVPMMVYLMGTEFSVSDQKARTEMGYTNAISIEEGMNTLIA